MFVGSVVWLYHSTGLKHYVRAISLINKMPEEARQNSWGDFTGTDQRGAKRGILAGAWIGRVWVWTTDGLKSFAIDENSIFSHFDGCRAEVRAKLNQGRKYAIEQEIYNNIKEWRGKAKAGDYVAVYVASAENGGTAGNLREIYDYNFWLFMNTEIDKECAK